MESLLFLVVIFGVMWMLFIRPQQRRLRAQQAMLASLHAGDEVVTAGGLIGTIRALDDSEVRLEVTTGVEVRLVRGAVSRRLGPDRVEPGDGDITP